jgi:Skp family chaperone for outer membrane proteins
VAFLLQNTPQNQLLYVNQANQQGWMIVMKGITLMTGCLLLISTTSVTFAAVYQCKQANGTTSFQTFPCSVEAATSDVVKLPNSTDKALKTYDGASREGLRAHMDAVDKAQKQKAEAQQKVEQSRINALEKKQRCLQAKQQLRSVMAGRKDADNRNELIEEANQHVEKTCYPSS